MNYSEAVPEEAWNPDLTAWLTAAAASAGFDASGVAPAESPVSAARFEAWIDLGRAGEMDWLKRRDEHGTLVRSSVRVAIPWARSVIVCAMNYNAPAPRSTDPAAPDAGWIARYAWSGSDGKPIDYHDDLLARLRNLEAALQAQIPCQTRCYVDTGPLVERTVALEAGIGWVGKNTCIIRQGTGSWLLMGVIVTSLELRAFAELSPDRCGSCTRCIEACPTDALVAPRQMDASLCIAYLTIEKKGPIPEPLREPMGRQVFGCDICQDVCPWNRKAPIALHSGLETRHELVNPSLDALAVLDSAAFRRLFKGSPLERTGKRRLHRNVAIAMGNSGEPHFASQLELWAAAEDPVLSEAATWALARLRRS